MTEPGFLTAAATVIERVPVPRLLLTSSRDPRRWGGLMATGAVGVVGLLPMTASLDDLADALARVASGETLILGTLADQLSPRPAPARSPTA